MSHETVEAIAHRGLGSKVRPVEITLRHAEWPGWRFVLRFTPSGVLGDFRMVHDAGRNPTIEEAAAEGAGMGAWERLADGGPPLTARLLRAVPLGELELEARRFMTEEANRAANRAAVTLNQQRPEMAQRVVARSQANARRIAGSMTQRPGRARRPDLPYALLAAVYVDCLDQANATEAAAKYLNMPAKTASNALNEARRRGLLTPPPTRGKAGGDLTAKARDLLKEIP